MPALFAEARVGDRERLYFHIAAYAPDADGGRDALDPFLGIAWSLPVTDRSARDRAYPRLDFDYKGMLA